MSDQIQHAFDVLKAAIQADEGYAWSWHCNLAMPAYDVGVSHKQANEAAANIMLTIFGTDTSQSTLYQQTMSQYNEPAK